MRRPASLAYPLAALALLILGWWAATRFGLVPSFLLPGPGRVFGALLDGLADGSLARHLGATLAATALGWLVGCASALVLAALIAESKAAERFLLWALTAIQSVPKVSIAPLVFLWAGFGVSGKLILVALICFFPVFANALVGFRSADPNLLDLLRVHGASRLHRFRMVKLPAAAPAIFSGLEVATSFALIGCVVMEFVGATHGMGFLIQDASNSFDLGTVFAAIIMLGLVGVTANWIVRAVRARVVFWGRAAAVVRG